ncbi:MAG TPA: sigma 54-interacting transcriptional regulator [Verrucomicrobiota bacterium]|nr:sigma 54-interacting transcriptional regulator [Verrucomicrobiota bacterium]
MNESETTARELLLLYEVSRRLDESLDMREVVQPVLEALARHMGMNYGTLTLLHRDTGQILIEAAHGLSDGQSRRAKYQLGEGVTGRVIETGEPVIVPRKSESPLLLDRTGRGKSPDAAFLCVPIKIDHEVVGALSVDTPTKPEAELQNDLRLLCIVASMIAQAVKLRRAALEEQERLAEENRRLRGDLGERFRPANMVGNSHEMREVYQQIVQVAPTNATVLICGETGTGKELVAQAIHYNSDRAQGPFVRVNCAALPEALVESELFGHVRGAYTGAVRDRKGRFEVANGGTLFLDEVGDVPPAIQVKLLRVLQEQEFERVGDTQLIKVNVRVVAATHRDLAVMVANGRFREDLFYRLNVFPIYVPPLRRQRSDIMPLAEHFLQLYTKRQRSRAKVFSAEARRRLLAYSWPGNVRELENAVERAVLICNSETIDVQHLPPALQALENESAGSDNSLAAQVSNLEKKLITEALRAAGGNITAAARVLQTTPRILAYKLRKLGMDPCRFR